MKGQPLRRRFGRIPASSAVLIEQLDQDRHCSFALSENLGMGGCALVASDPIPPGSLLKLYLSIRSEVVEAEGRIAHVNRRADGRYDVGIEFVRMDQVHRARYNLSLGAGQGDFERPRTYLN